MAILGVPNQVGAGLRVPANKASAPSLPFQSGNRVSFLIGDDDTYQAALQAIDSAKQSIQFETFTFNGQHGLGIAQALIRARQRGVNVQVVLDPKAMLVSNQSQLATMMAKAGIDVNLYYETHLNDPLVAIDHAKDLVIDGQTAIVGGTNFDRRIKYDFNYQIAGPAVKSVQDEFTQSWKNSRAITGVLVNRPGLPPVAPIALATGAPAAGGDTSIAITETGPKNPTGTLNPAPTDQTYLATLAAIRSATTSIDVLMFTMDTPAEMAALKAAAARGVKVRVLLNPGTPGKILGKAFNWDAVQNLAHTPGVSVRWFRLAPGNDQMHAKVAIFDGQTLLGGSTNFVHSANQDNHELGVWLKGPVASQAQATYNWDWKHMSDPVAPMTFFQKVEAYIVGLVSHII